jgi:hypothetical protein
MAFEEQFSQISEFAQAKIALEQERIRIKKLDRIAEETRTRQTELFDVQLRQARQQADDNQRKLDMAQLEQKHTADLASAWVAMMDETDQNETLSRKGAGTGRITTTTGSREQTASLTPDGRVVVDASSLRYMEDTGRGGDNRILFQAENGSGWVEDPTGVRVRVPEPSYTVQYKVPGASSTAKDAYRQALVAAAREAPGAIDIFAKISEALVRSQDMPEHLKLANDHMRYLLSGGAGGGGRGGAQDIEYANKLFTARNNGWKLVEDTLKSESPEAIDKKWDTNDAAVKTQLGAISEQIGQVIGRLGAGASIVAAVEKAQGRIAAGKQVADMLAAGADLMGAVGDITSGTASVTAKEADLKTAKGKLVQLSQLYQQNAAQLRDQHEARMHESDVAAGRQGFAASLYEETFRKTSDPFASSRITIATTQEIYGEVHNVWPRIQASAEFQAYTNLPLSANTEEVKAARDRLLAKYRSVLPTNITSRDDVFAYTVDVFNSAADQARRFRLSPIYQVAPAIPDANAPLSSVVVPSTEETDAAAAQAQKQTKARPAYSGRK